MLRVLLPPLPRLMPTGKRALSMSPTQPKKKARSTPSFNPIKVASAENAALVDADTPLSIITRIISERKNSARNSNGDAVVYWMRMCDLRVKDNKALSMASERAQKDGVPLIALFVISPQDYAAHDRSARRIDFVLRNLRSVQSQLQSLKIPLYVHTHASRRNIPQWIVDTLTSKVHARALFANLEYEVDELRRDIQVLELASSQIDIQFVHDRTIVEPDTIKTNEDKTYSVYSPYQRKWIARVNENLPYYLNDWPLPTANAQLPEIQGLSTKVPEYVPGFQLGDDEAAKMREVWPHSEEAAAHTLDRFIHGRVQTSNPGFDESSEESEKDAGKDSRIEKYKDERDFTDRDATARISPYLTSGIISTRECMRATMRGSNMLDGGKKTSIGKWVQEVAWRDFYINVLAGFPRVSMGRPFLEKYSAVKWEPDVDGKNLNAWKEGKTGVPIVDAGMRCLNEFGWMHNRLRMVTAMFLTKDMMIDWREGERYFMEKLIDGDLASNNGGWQWSASTGVDPAPYFRIFNPYTQSLKTDPDGNLIRRFVPELKDLKGKDIHNPSKAYAKKVGYPLPVVDHYEVRDRALRRYKNPGDE